MQQLTKSLGSFTWAMSLFGLQQMSNALGAASGSNKAVGALDEVSRVSLEQCGASIRQTFEAGDKLQRDVIDLMFRFVSLGGGRGVSSPVGVMRHVSGVAQGATGAVQPSSAPEEELGWGPVPPIA